MAPNFVFGEFPTFSMSMGSLRGAGMLGPIHTTYELGPLYMVCVLKPMHIA